MNRAEALHRIWGAVLPAKVFVGEPQEVLRVHPPFVVHEAPLLVVRLEVKDVHAAVDLVELPRDVQRLAHVAGDGVATLQFPLDLFALRVRIDRSVVVDDDRPLSRAALGEERGREQEEEKRVSSYNLRRERVRCGELIPAKRVATVHKILSSRIYSGDFDWKGKTYKGTYESLVTRELWQRVQDALAGRRGTRIRKAKHDFPFSGLISCGHCGCALVGDIKKGKYVYYRCSGFKGKEGRDLILYAP